MYDECMRNVKKKNNQDNQLFTQLIIIYRLFVSAIFYI